LFLFEFEAKFQRLFICHDIENLFVQHFKVVYLRRDLQKDFVVNDGVENSSTVVLLIHLVEETMEQGMLVLNTKKGSGPDEISLLIVKKIVLVIKKNYLFVCLTCRCFLSMHLEGVLHHPFVQEWFKKKCFELSWNIYYIGGP
jgi:hypothetical protein